MFASKIWFWNSKIKSLGFVSFFLPAFFFFFLSALFFDESWLLRTMTAHGENESVGSRKSSIFVDLITKNFKLDKYTFLLMLSHSVMSDSMTLWTVAHQALLFIGFSRQEYWSELHALLQGIFSIQWWNPRLLSLLHRRWFLYHWATREAPNIPGSSVCK